VARPSRSTQARRNGREAINIEEINLDYLVNLDDHEASEAAI